MVVTNLLMSFRKTSLMKDLFENLLHFRLFSVQRKMSIGKPIECSITAKLQENLQPSYLKVINESYMHNVPKNAETHFKVVVVSEHFKELNLLKRHRKVNDLLKDELQNGLHALSIVAKTADQWKNEEIEPSPNCKGGFGK